ncbi:MAG: hypothetical protein AB1486_17290 [Planctomycetota bacterium]
MRQETRTGEERIIRIPARRATAATPAVVKLESPPAPQQRPSTVILFLAALMIAFWFTRLHLQLNPVKAPAGPSPFADGRTLSPISYRGLVPWCVADLEAAGFPNALGLTSADLFGVIEILSLVGLVFAFRRLLMPHFDGKVRQLLSLSIVPLLSFNFLLPRLHPYWHPADVPAVLFCTLALICLREARWTLYYALFVVASFNRATTCFFIAATLIVYWGALPRRHLALHTIAQLVLWLGIQGVLGAFYERPSPGERSELLLANNLSALLDGQVTATLLSSFGFVWIVILAGASRITDWFTRRALLVCPLFLTGILVAAPIEEVRLLGEMAPLVLLAAALVIRGPEPRAASPAAVYVSDEQGAPREPA